MAPACRRAPLWLVPELRQPQHTRQFSNLRCPPHRPIPQMPERKEPVRKVCLLQEPAFREQGACNGAWRGPLVTTIPAARHVEGWGVPAAADSPGPCTWDAHRPKEVSGVLTSLEFLRHVTRTVRSFCFSARNFHRRGEIHHKVTFLSRFSALCAVRRSRMWGWRLAWSPRAAVRN